MNIIDQFLTESFFSGKVNAPTFAYKCVNGKMPSPPIGGREASHVHQDYNGIDVDENIPIKVLDDLNKLKIEIRSSCEGDSSRHLTFLIFRLLPLSKNVNKSKLDKIINKISSNKDVTSCWDVGQEGYPRIVITSNLWFGKKSDSYFFKWWESLAKIIKGSL